MRTNKYVLCKSYQGFEKMTRPLPLAWLKPYNLLAVHFRHLADVNTTFDISPHNYCLKHFHQDTMSHQNNATLWVIAGDSSDVYKPKDDFVRREDYNFISSNFKYISWSKWQLPVFKWHPPVSLYKSSQFFKEIEHRKLWEII